MNIYQRRFFLITLFLAPGIFSISLKAQVKLPSLFTDNMVLQQHAEVAIWGWDNPGKTISIAPSWSKKIYKTKVPVSGKWALKIATPAAGGPYEIPINDGIPLQLANVLIGEVWLCSGQSNMEMPMKGFKGQPLLNSNETILKSSNKNIRLYIVPRSSAFLPQDNSKPSPWKEANPESVSNFSATAYYFGRLLNEILKVPIGLVESSYGGSPVESWMDAATLKNFSDIKIPASKDSIKVPNRTPTTLYNGMIHPIIGYGIKGAIWYQGETNYDRPDEYEQLFPAMVSKWRNLWGMGEFPFYYVQIAPYNYAQLPPYNSGGKFNSAYLRDAQRKSLDKIPNSAMAVLLDAGDGRTIHPPNKKPAGERLALLALAKTYGLKGFGYESPAYDTLIINGSIAEIKFKNAPNGITSYGKELSNFEVAGNDKIFYPAKAVIKKNSVLVSSSKVKGPVAVRYAFRDFVVGDLFSTGGLPVSSFRTDNW